MYCRQCGQPVPDGTKFCPECGARQQEPNANPYGGAQVPPNANPYGGAQVPPNANPYGGAQVPPNANPYGGAQVPPNANPYGGAQVPPNANPYAGYYNAPPQYAQPQYGTPYRAPSVGFGEAVKRFFSNYVNFEGRASLSEFWWVMLFQFLIGIAFTILSAVGIALSPYVALVIQILSVLASLGLFLPSLSLSVRRLHDIGKPGVYLLMGLIPFAGGIILLVYFCTASDGGNQWGR